MSSPTAGGVFISYRRRESSGIAGRLYDRLAARFGDGQVFMDVDTIALGVDFTQVIAQAVNNCTVLLAIIGPGWLTATDEDGQRRLDDPGDVVRVEIQTALERDIRVIPILVEGAVMPRRQQLPEELAGLAHRNAHFLRHESFRSDADRLLAAIEPILPSADASSVASGRARVVPVVADAAEVAPGGQTVPGGSPQAHGPSRLMRAVGTAQEAGAIDELGPGYQRSVPKSAATETTSLFISGDRPDTSGDTHPEDLAGRLITPRSTTETLSGPILEMGCARLTDGPVAVALIDGPPGTFSGRDVHVWDLAAGRRLGSIPVSRSGQVKHIAVADMGDRPLAFIAEDFVPLRVWDLIDGATLVSLDPCRGVTGVASTLVDGHPVAVTVSGAFQGMKIWDLTTGRLMAADSQDDSSEVICAQLDGDPVVVTASHSEGGSLVVRDLRTRVRHTTVQARKSRYIRQVVCAQVKGRLTAFVITYDYELYHRFELETWDLVSGEVNGITRLDTGHSIGPVAGTELDGNPVVISVGFEEHEQVLVMWDFATRDRLAVARIGGSSLLSSIACTKLDGCPVAVTGGNEEINIWNLR